ncbi:hypothetical protein K437DRAFT_257744 [Tilletiaria anomala UBC 951]|uniref:Uncharacterized protein n=1 Tax=Tilletiaria anomala (strain ATCC 24038 / CBS 436.72 / UBC 951) TaxID=1037660 RepID=A0A066VVY4_TILAU|nr:uncharacterized protein K437DRAFT_257744 [Tilletiaria anomala UBC 951]KDN42720.1 hypothetical protein K437DRAFT_257744 [Tilletiaria anomala UBC 951]
MPEASDCSCSFLVAYMRQRKATLALVPCTRTLPSPQRDTKVSAPSAASASSASTCMVGSWLAFQVLNMAEDCRAVKPHQLGAGVKLAQLPDAAAGFCQVGGVEE